MKIALAREYGPPARVVRVEEVERPTPEGDEVLVRIKAASANRADLDAIYPRWQFMRLFTGPRRPRVASVGVDVAGSVAEVGPRATRFKPGDDVFFDMFGMGRKGGAFAEFACVPERRPQLMPPKIGYEQAAALPHSAVLAVMAMRPRAGHTFGAGEDVLVVGASGNVGPFVVQIAKARGATVTAVASGPKLDFVRSLGADHVIDYKTSDPQRSGEHFDLIVDVDGHQGVLGWRKSLKKRGVYTGLGGPVSWMLASVIAAPLARATGRRMGMLLGWRPFREDAVDELTKLVADGVIEARIDRRFSLDEARDALVYLDQGKNVGKVLVIP